MVTYKTEAASLMDESVKFYFANVLQQYKTAAENEVADAAFFFLTFVEKCNHSDIMLVLQTC
jgi:hypothetical protein